MQRTIWCIAVLGLFTADVTWAQNRSLLNSQLPTGAIGQTQILRRPELAHVWQPVLVRVPDGAMLSFGEDDGFWLEQPEAQLVSLQVGSTYRLKVSSIPHQYGDVYPTIELIDRLHAPPGKETRYPVPVQITTEELAMALSGKFVTRVIYVEDPRNAVAARDLPEQRYFEALPDEDPYEVASRIGRPIAILRMGSVVPNTKNMLDFLFGSPPILRHQLWPKQPKYTPSELEPSDRPAELEKRTTVPSSPTQPEAGDEQAPVPADVPAKMEIEERPETPVVDELNPFNDDDNTAGEEADEDGSVDEDLGDDLFGEPDAADEQDDPFEDIE